MGTLRRSISRIGPVASIVVFVRDRVLHLPPAEYRGLVPAIASVAAAALLVIFIERPVERWRQSRIRSAKPGRPAVAQVGPVAIELGARQTWCP